VAKIKRGKNGYENDANVSASCSGYEEIGEIVITCTCKSDRCRRQGPWSILLTRQEAMSLCADIAANLKTALP